MGISHATFFSWENKMAYLDNDEEKKYHTSGGSTTEGEAAGAFETSFLVPPKLYLGDRLDPLRFQVREEDAQGAKSFVFFGRYNAGVDIVEFALGGSTGTRFKLAVSDGNSPYGWKAKRHGITRTDPGGDDSVDAQEETFQQADLLSVAHALVRSSARRAVVDAKAVCVGPWSFYGPSLSETFYNCKLKVVIYSEGQHEDIRATRLIMVSPFPSLRTQDESQQAEQQQQGRTQKVEEEEGQELSLHENSQGDLAVGLASGAFCLEVRNACEDWTELLLGGAAVPAPGDGGVGSILLKRAH